MVAWTPERIKKLRGKRTQEEFGKVIKVPKNTVWRWEAGRSRPDSERARRLAKLAERESFLKDWTIENSIEIPDGVDLEKVSKEISKHFMIDLEKLVRDFES